MKKVCIIGNSHLGAFKLALDGEQIEGVSDRYEFDTFGSIRASLLQTEIKTGKLVPTRDDVAKNFEKTSGGQSEIKLADYDAFVIAVRNSPFWIRPFLSDTDIVPVSERMIQAIHADFLKDWSIDFTRTLARAAPKARVFFVGRPLNSDKDFVAKRVLPQLKGEDGAGASAIKDQILLRLRQAVRDMPVAENVTLVRPPDHLLDRHQLFTKSEYARGAVKADTGLRQVFKADDTQHMNGDYGREMLVHMLAAS